MGRRLENWLSKASVSSTRRAWKYRWQLFADWIVAATNPLTSEPYMACAADAVDDAIRADFEALPSHLFQDKYRDILTKYLAYLKQSDIAESDNTVQALISSIRSFFTNEAVSIRVRGVPKPEMAMNEHRFTLEELRRMWWVADLEGKARLNTAVSLGWGVGDFRDLHRTFIESVVRQVDDDGYATFDARRGKTRARVRGILKPDAVVDLQQYLHAAPTDQTYLWTSRDAKTWNRWLRDLVHDAGVEATGTIRFHLLRKFTFGVVRDACGMEEAKLLVGKTIPASDATYMQRIEERLLDKYKRFAYPHLQLDGGLEFAGSGELTRRVVELERAVARLERAFHHPKFQALLVR